MHALTKAAEMMFMEIPRSSSGYGLKRRANRPPVSWSQSVALATPLTQPVDAQVMILGDAALHVAL
jgi:hypothetical protein